MADYTSKNLLKANGNPMPQIGNPTTGDFIPLEGDEHGMFVRTAGYDPDNDKIQVGTARDKFRDEFFDFNTTDNWDVVQTGSGHAISVAGAANGARYLNINTGTAISTETIIQTKKSFKLPLKVAIGLSLSQRIANQEFYIELVGVGSNGNVETDVTYPSTSLNDTKNAMSLKFSGTTATNAIAHVRGFGISELVSSAVTTVSSAATGTTPNFIPSGLFELNLDMEQAIWSSWAIDSLAAATGHFKRSQNLPDPSKEYKIRIRTRNLSTAPASATDIRVHFIRVLDSTRMTVDFSRHMGRTTDVASSLPVYISGAGTLTTSISGTPTVSVSALPTPSPNILNSAATTNASSIKTSAATLYSITASNISASARYLKIYNKASAPTVGTDIPALIVPISAGTVFNIDFGSLGMRLATGLAIAITGAAADSDTTAIAAGEVKVVTSYV